MSKRTESFVPIDLVLTGLLGAFMVVVAVGQLEGVTGQALVGFIAVLFAPGYALVSVLFPGENSSTGVFEERLASVTQKSGRVTAIERIILAVGLSVCLIPLYALFLNFVFEAIWPASLLGLTGGVTIGLTIVAGIRREKLEPANRYSPRISGVVPKGLSESDSGAVGSYLTLSLVIGFVIAGGGIGMALLGADHGEDFTEFAVLTEDDETGEFVASNYPNEIPQDETDSVHLRIGNNEGETMEYSVVVLLQSIDNQGEIQEEQTLDTLELTVGNGETLHEPYEISPELTGEDLRLTYLLYVDSVPETAKPTQENADRYVHLWIDVPE